MIDQGNPNHTAKRPKPILMKLVIGVAIFFGLFFVGILGTGVVATYIYPVATPESLVKIQAEMAAERSRAHADGKPAPIVDNPTSGTITVQRDASPTGRDEPPLLASLPGIPADKIGERKKLNAIYKQCVETLAECADWDRMTFEERRKKLEQVRWTQQSSYPLLNSQFDIENSMARSEKNPKLAKERYEAIRQMNNRFNAIIRTYSRLRFENAVRNEQWFYAADAAPTTTEMIYYYRRSNISGFQKFAFISTRTIERGYHSFGNKYPSARQFMPNW